MVAVKAIPKGISEQILEWSVIPTFDLVIEYGNKGIIIVNRKIAPYQNLWSLPGRRMLKGENIEDTLTRIANQELGLLINPLKREFLGQYTGKFKTRHNRQDLSTGYFISALLNQKINFDKMRYSSMRLIRSRNEIPVRTGAMYKFYY